MTAASAPKSAAGSTGRAADDVDVPARGPWPRAAVSVAIYRFCAAGRREVLLIERGKGALRGLWSLPGGHVEPGETVREAVMRELAEETGIAAELRGLVDVVDVIARDSNGELRAHYILSVFFGIWTGREPVAASDAAAARFVALADLGGYHMTDGAEAIITRAAELLAGLARNFR